jgi:DNA-binding NarL/FixJ family response regulator
VVGVPAALGETVAGAIARARVAALVVVAWNGAGGAALDVEGRAGPEVAAAARLLGPDALGPTVARAMQDRDGPEVVVDATRLGPDVAGAVVVPLPVGPRRALVVATRVPRVFEREEIAFVALAAAVLALAGARSTAIPHAPDGRPAGAVEREPSLRLLLVQDHAAMCEALSAALVAEDDVADVRRARSVAEARAAVDDVDVVLVDLALPGGGCELVGELRARNPDVGVLVLASDPEGPDAATAVERGAAGVLSSDTRLQDLVEAIRRVGRGETLLPVEEVVRMLRLAGRRREREQDDRRRLEALSPREREVLQLLASGVEHHDAATRLHVSPRTHRNHVANILSKLGVHSQLRAVLFAVRHGAVDVGDPDPDA